MTNQNKKKEESVGDDSKKAAKKPRKQDETNFNSTRVTRPTHEENIAQQ